MDLGECPRLGWSCCVSKSFVQVLWTSFYLDFFTPVPVTGSVKPSTPTVVTQPAVLLTSSNSSLGVFEFPKVWDWFSFFGTFNHGQVFTFQQSGMCSLAVNFLDSKFAQPSSGLEDSGNCVEEVVSITGSPTLIAGFLPVCGDMSGQISEWCQFLNNYSKGSDFAWFQFTFPTVVVLWRRIPPIKLRLP